MDDLNKQNNNPSQSFIGTGEGEAPLATPAQMPDLMRTSVSDLKTLQETGGQNVKPYIPETVSPAAFAPQATPAAPAAGQQNDQIFPAPAASQTMASETQKVPAKQHQKGLVGGLVAFVVIIGLAAAGYFFVYPKFFGEPAPETPIASNPESPLIGEAIPPVEENQESLVPIVPIASSSEATSTNPADLAETAISALAKPADSTQEAVITSFETDSLKKTITNSTTEAAATKEVLLKKGDGSPFSFGEIMSVLLPTVFTPETASQFEDFQYSIISFSNSQGTWLGYVGKAKTTADLAALKNKVNLLEAASFNSVFLKESGAQQGEWKSGTNNRYLVFSQNGNALNYGWFGDKLLITTSYPAWQAISAKIQ